MLIRKNTNEGDTQSKPPGFGAGWQQNDERIDYEPFLLQRVASDLSGERRARLAELLGQLERRGVVMIEPHRQVGPIPAGVAILHDQKERAICTLDGRGVGEWVRDMLDGSASSSDLLARLDDILATTPETELHEDQE